MKKVKKGFTLIELLVVVLILGILTAVALPQYTKAVEKTRGTEAITILKSITTGAEEYYLVNGNWPASFSELAVGVPNWTGNTKWGTNGAITDTRSNKDWSIQLYNEPGSLSQYGIFIGRISGKYAGTGFIFWRKELGNVVENKIICAERNRQGVSFSGPAGSYCHNIWGGTLVETTTTRFYTLP